MLVACFCLLLSPTTPVHQSSLDGGGETGALSWLLDTRNPMPALCDRSFRASGVWGFRLLPLSPAPVQAILTGSRAGGLSGPKPPVAQKPSGRSQRGEPLGLYVGSVSVGILLSPLKT
ncbi:hypothetical protein NDU88_007846 [Pleurodeles waltl]|uniref:Uncharacterized protein n=1 Tax=Pleurodeles waltl TaxID=8319 RepID=A0AAV7PUM7_PLEWA|nr:hypothetical protein NDU88_007846 [Pleurodeles waltl]